MDYIYTITSEDEIRDTFFENLRRHKIVDSAIYYLDKGAQSYYEISASNTSLHENIHLDILKKNITDIDTLISLGCGNSLREKLIISHFNHNKNIDYIGIDSSMTMLDLSMKTFEGFEICKYLACADFSSPKLRTYIKDKTQKRNNNIFTFLGATIGNLGIEYSMDLISDMVQKGDYLLFDVRVRQSNELIEDRRLYEYYRDNYAHDESNNKNIFDAIESFGITKEGGTVGIEMNNNEALNSLNIKLKYLVKNTINHLYKNRNMCLLPGDLLTLKTYLAVDKDSLSQYLINRGFEKVDIVEKDEFGYFLFKKA